LVVHARFIATPKQGLDHTVGVHTLLALGVTLMTLSPELYPVKRH
jgi:hypothetical protein